MTDKEKMSGLGGEEMAGTNELDHLFCKTDFSIENPDLLTERLWQEFQEKSAKRSRTVLGTLGGDRELTDDELKKVAGGRCYPAREEDSHANLI